jgi:hypothetical protein
MPVIPATWEAEIIVQGQPGQRSLQDPILIEKTWAQWCAYYTNNVRKHKTGGSWLSWAKSQTSPE